MGIRESAHFNEGYALTVAVLDVRRRFMTFRHSNSCFSRQAPCQQGIQIPGLSLLAIFGDTKSMYEHTKTIPNHISGRSERRGAPQLRVIYSPSYAGRRVFPLLKGETKIGRAEKEDATTSFPLDDSMSKVHAHIKVSENDGMMFLRDVSKNGTYRNKVRMQKSGEWLRLSEGDVVRFGHTVCMVRHEPVKPDDFNIPSFVGQSLVARDLRCRIANAAKAENVWILLRGETGCGKEVVARAIHQLSPRSKGPFVAINCAAIPETLAPTELFGSTKHAYTNAAERPGCFRAAHGGTLFLDEIGDMDPKLQPQLFRTLSEREVIPVGSEKPVKTDFRLVTATNQPLWRDGQSHFRKELFARIAQFQICIPPLRDRREDVLPLLLHFYPEAESLLSAEFVERLLCHDWPLNVRQLYNCSQQLRIERSTKAICQLLDQLEEPSSDVELATKSSESKPPLLPESRPDRFVPTREQLDTLMNNEFGNISKVAALLCCDRRSVRRYLQLHGLSAENYRTCSRPDDSRDE